MRLGKLLGGISSTVFIAGVAFATPLANSAGASISTSVAASPSVSALPSMPDLQFTAIDSIPGKVGNVLYAESSRCILSILGADAALTPQDADDILKKRDRSKAGLMKKSFALLICGDAASGFDISVANAAGLKRMVSKGGARAQASSIVNVKFQGPNRIASAILGNQARLGGARFISNDYEVTVGTDAQGELWLTIAERIGASPKLIYFSTTQGGYYANLDAESIPVYHRAVRQFAFPAPMIVLHN